MAHIEKYQAPALGNMFAHYDRTAETERGVVRDNIDPARTHLNYDLRPRAAGVSQLDAVTNRIAALDLKRAPRKDAVRMCDCVVTMPKGFEGDQREFFEAVCHTLDGIFGRGNVVSAYVHLDETSPHVHYAFVPVTDDGRLAAKSILTRQFMQRFHGRLEEGVSQRLGIDRAGLTLTVEEREERGGRYVDLNEFKDAKAATERAQDIAERARQKALGDVENARQMAHAAHDGAVAAEREAQAVQARLEGLRRAEEAEAREIADLDRAIEQAELQPPAETLAESARTLWMARSDGEREEGLGSEIEGLRSRIEELEGANQQARERMADLDRALPGLRERCRGLRARFENAQVRVREVIGRLREVPETVSAWALDIAKKMGKRTYDPRSLEYQIESATRSAAIDRRQRGSVSHGRDWGRGIDR